jgi:hypothetical protein
VVPTMAGVMHGNNFAINLVRTLHQHDMLPCFRISIVLLALEDEAAFVVENNRNSLVRAVLALLCIERSFANERIRRIFLTRHKCQCACYQCKGE